MTFLDRPKASGTTPRILRPIDILRPDAIDMARIFPGDILLLDLGDHHGQKAAAARAARAALPSYLARHPVDAIVGVHEPCSVEELALDLEAVARCGVAGVLLRGARTGADLQMVDVMLSAVEVEQGATPGGIRILALVGDNASGLLSAASFAGKSSRLAGLGWHGARLKKALSGADYGAVHESMKTTARDISRLAAATAGVAAIDWIDPNLSEADFESACRTSAADGFGFALFEGAACSQQNAG